MDRMKRRNGTSKRAALDCGSIASSFHVHKATGNQRKTLQMFMAGASSSDQHVNQSRPGAARPPTCCLTDSARLGSAAHRLHPGSAQQLARHVACRARGALPAECMYGANGTLMASCRQAGMQLVCCGATSAGTSAPHHLKCPAQPLQSPLPAPPSPGCVQGRLIWRLDTADWLRMSAQRPSSSG